MILSPWAEQPVRGDCPEKFVQGHLAHKWQSQISNMGFSTPYPVVFFIVFHYIPSGTHKRDGKNEAAFG